MRYKITVIISILVLLITVILYGCGISGKTEDVNKDKIVNNEDNKIEDSGKDDKNSEEKLEQGNEDDVGKEGIPSSLSGIYGPEEKVNRRPVAVMFDNHPSARWQAGLGQAEIVYEFLVEGDITRYMGLFLLNDPELIGPIRSARPYFITTLLEYDAVYVRCGGSEAAKADVKKLKIADIDGLSSSAKVFWRIKNNGKKAPHNLYSSMNIIRKEQKDRGYRLTADFEPFKFYKEDTDIEGISAENVLIKYSNSNTTKYVYDKESKFYKRYKDGKLHVDETDNTPIHVKNIIVQQAYTKVIDNEGRLRIDLIGKGRGWYITNGNAIEITWEKKRRSDKTIYYDKQNTEIKLNPGITWIQVVKPTNSVVIE